MNGELIASWDPRFESLYHGANPQTIYEEMLSIGPSATPEQIVDKGRDASTELHKCFTWDDRVAAEKYRLEEARQITHHLVIRRVETQTQAEPAPRIFVKSDVYEGYRSIEYVVKNDTEYEKLLQRALSELIAFQKKYAFLSNREELVRLIETVSDMAKSA